MIPPAFDYHAPRTVAEEALATGAARPGEPDESAVRIAKRELCREGEPVHARTRQAHDTRAPLAGEVMPCEPRTGDDPVPLSAGQLRRKACRQVFHLNCAQRRSDLPLDLLA